MTTDNLIKYLDGNRFREWVLNPNDAELNAFWHNWLTENPNMQKEITVMKSIVLDRKISHNAFKEAAMWQKIQNTIADDNEEEIPQLRPIYKKWWAVAAALAVLVSASVFIFLNNKINLQTIHTAYGETRKMVLPDGSEVMLNVNSTLSFSDKWIVGHDRHVNLKGEAYFIVNEQGASNHRDRFIVHTPQLDVEVLGTRFNVNTYRPETQVVLQKGSVEIVIDNNKQEKKYKLAVGERAIFDNKKNVVAIAKVNTETFVGWKDKRFVFDQTPLCEVAIMLENTYGLTVILKDKDLTTKQISGEISISERKAFLAALSNLYALKINDQHPDTLYISK